jgi:hypothetical protein
MRCGRETPERTFTAFYHTKGEFGWQRSKEWPNTSHVLERLWNLIIPA